MKEVQNQKVNEISEDSLKMENGSFCNEFSMLLLRSYRNSYRNPTHLKTRTFSFIMLTLFTFWLFYDLGYDYSSAISKAGFIFLSWNTQITQNLYGTLLNILAEKDILQKEYKNKTYGVAALYFSRAVFELPIMLISGFIFLVPIYFGTNLENDFGNFLTYLTVS